MLKPYLVYSRSLGSSEGALLAFANTVQQARVVAWKSFDARDLTDDYLDLTAKLLRGRDWLYEEGDSELLANNTPHIVIFVKSCNQCDYWGHSPIGEDGLCNDCRRDNQEGQ